MHRGLAFVLIWSVVAGPASAQRLTPPCALSRMPDSTFTLGTGADSVFSDGATTYTEKGGTGCYTVDIKVSSAVRLAAGARVSGLGWKLASDFSVPDIPELCGVYPAYGTEPQYQQTTTIYRRRAREREFVLIASKATQGVWEYTTCRLDLPHWDFPKPIAGTDTYRVAVKVKAGKYWRPVRIKATRQ
jgi:hypothetical protein